MAKADITGRLNLDSTGFERGIQRSKQSVKGFAKSSMATFVRMGAAFAGIGLVKSIVGLGTAAAETASKFNAVFGSAADAMNEKVQELRKTIPSTTEEMQGALCFLSKWSKLQATLPALTTCQSRTHLQRFAAPFLANLNQ
jgi:hypothetical protein